MKCTEFASECKRGCTHTCVMKGAYYPSNGSEGMWFEDRYCSNCIHDNPDPNSPKKCEVILGALLHYPPEPDYPMEWRVVNGEPTCTKFVKWDWGNDGDPDDPDNPKRPPDPPDPNQIDLFPLYPDETQYNERRQTSKAPALRMLMRR